jgi:hypothetical protein
MLFTENNLKNFRITKGNNYRNTLTKYLYYYYYACAECGYPFIHSKKSGKFCSNSCANTGENNSMFGKTGDKHPGFGIKRPEVSLKMSGENHPLFGITGELSPGWKGGVWKNNIPLYNTYAHQLEPIEKCVRDPEDPSILNIFCTYSGCKKQYRPTRDEVGNRIKGINSNDTHRFYCSDDCKQICPIFHKTAKNLMERDAENAGRITRPNQQHIRINQTENKNRRFRENGGICDWCETPVTLEISVLHHEVPVSSNFLMADDPDNHWLLCKACNKKAHQLLNCNYYELRLRRVCKT